MGICHASGFFDLHVCQLSIAIGLPYYEIIMANSVAISCDWT